VSTDWRKDSAAQEYFAATRADPPAQALVLNPLAHLSLLTYTVGTVPQSLFHRSCSPRCAAVNRTESRASSKFVCRTPPFQPPLSRGERGGLSGSRGERGGLSGAQNGSCSNQGRMHHPGPRSRWLEGSASGLSGEFVNRARSASDGCLCSHRANIPRWSRTNRRGRGYRRVPRCRAIGAGGLGSTSGWLVFLEQSSVLCSTYPAE
jgi:hypothetical protein